MTFVIRRLIIGGMDTNIKSVIAELLELGLTQAEIAAAGKITQGRVSQLLTGGSCRYETGLRLTGLLKKRKRKAAHSAEA